MKKLIFVFLIIIFISGCETTPRKEAISFKEPTYCINNTAYIPISAIIKNYSLDYTWDSVTRVLVLKKQEKEAVFCIGTDISLINNNCIRMQALAKMHSGEIMIPASFVHPTLEELFLPPSIYKKEKILSTTGKYVIRTIVIDAGHGGKDPGAISPIGIREKDIVLNIAKRLRNYLQEEGIGLILTRESDRFISLYNRADIANEKRADFFISIHANSAPARYIDGVEIFYLSDAVDDTARATASLENLSLQYENSSFDINGAKSGVSSTLWDMLCTENRTESIELAHCISEKMSKNLGIVNRGVKAAKFYVLKGAKMPSVLIEVGFLSNKNEAKKLKDKYYQDRLGRAIADGILLYKDRYERTEGFTRR